VRASVNASGLGWQNAWDGGGGGWEYWFPRFQDTAAGKNPLIILGGERQFSGGRLEAGVTDDSVVNPLVSKALRGFLPRIFPSQFDTLEGDDKEKVEDPWEMEWVRVLRSRSLDAELSLLIFVALRLVLWGLQRPVTLLYGLVSSLPMR
jgi:hypothetical protein